MKVAILWMRFGPYHLARLRTAAAAGRELGARVIGLEVASRDHYAWDPADADDDFDRRTLFPARDYRELSGMAIRGAVRRALDDVRPDVVAINGWGTAEARSALAWVRRHAGVRAVLMSETHADRPRPRWKEALKGRLIRRCDAALVGGGAQAEYLEGLGFPADRIFAGYDVVDNAHFVDGARAAREAAAAIRARLGLPDRYFFACTRFLPRKNVDGLLRAYARYRATASDAPWGLVIAGAGEEAHALRRLACELDLPDVQWPGFVQYPELPAYYGLASAFVHPARSEPWGLVVNEAAASGLPLLIARPVGAARELVRDGENGLLFDPANPGAIAHALTTIACLSQAERDRMGRLSARIANNWPARRFGEGLFAAVDAARGATEVP